MATHQKYRLDRDFMRRLDATTPKEYADDQLRGFAVRVAASGAISYTYRYTGADGKPKRTTIGRWPDLQPGDAREKAKAEAALLDHKRDGLATRLAKPKARAEAQKKVGTLTLGEYLTQRYDDHLRTHGRSGTRNADMIRAAFPDLLNRDLASITAWDIEKWRSERLRVGRKPATCNRVINALRGAFSRAVEWEILEAHPMTSVRKQREPEPDTGRYLLPDEEARLRAALDAHEDRVRAEQALIRRGRRRRVGEPEHAFADMTKPVVLIALNTGARRGEVLKLRWSDVDLTHARVVFCGTNTKNGRSRTLPLNAEALDVFRKWRGQCPDSAVYVFPLEDGSGPQREVKYWPRVRDAAAITRLRFRLHDTRHHAASRLVMAGIDVFSVSRVLGHADTRMTARYSHLSPQHMRDVMAVLDQPNDIGTTADDKSKAA